MLKLRPDPHEAFAKAVRSEAAAEWPKQQIEDDDRPREGATADEIAHREAIAEDIERRARGDKKILKAAKQIREGQYGRPDAELFYAWTDEKMHVLVAGRGMKRKVAAEMVEALVERKGIPIPTRDKKGLAATINSHYGQYLLKKNTPNKFKEEDELSGPRLISGDTDSQDSRMPKPASLDLRQASPRWAQLTDRLTAVRRERSRSMHRYTELGQEIAEARAFGELKRPPNWPFPAPPDWVDDSNDLRLLEARQLADEINAFAAEELSIVEPLPGRMLSELEEARQEGSKAICDALRPAHDEVAQRYSAAIVELVHAADGYEEFVGAFTNRPFDWTGLGPLKKLDDDERAKLVARLVWAKVVDHLAVEIPESWGVAEAAAAYQEDDDDD